MLRTQDNLLPALLRPGLPNYPPVRHVVRVDYTVAGGLVYSGRIEQWNGSPSLRDREAVYVIEPNGITVTAGTYVGRLVGAYAGPLGTRPLVAVSLACCPVTSSSSSSVTSSATSSSSSGPGCCRAVYGRPLPVFQNQNVQNNCGYDVAVIPLSNQNQAGGTQYVDPNSGSGGYNSCYWTAGNDGPAVQPATFVVPAGVFQVTITAVGGGSRYAIGDGTYGGGGGACARSTFACTPGQILYVMRYKEYSDPLDVWTPGNVWASWTGKMPTNISEGVYAVRGGIGTGIGGATPAQQPPNSVLEYGKGGLASACIGQITNSGGDGTDCSLGSTIIPPPYSLRDCGGGCGGPNGPGGNGGDPTQNPPVTGKGRGWEIFRQTNEFGPPSTTYNFTLTGDGFGSFPGGGSNWNSGNPVNGETLPVTPGACVVIEWGACIPGPGSGNSVVSQASHSTNVSASP